MVHIKEKAPGITVASVSNAACSAEVSLYGGQVLSFKPKGRDEVLFVSTESAYEKGKAIRGGIPVCWPWFGAHPDNAALPQHGFLRLIPWSLADVREKSDRTVLTLECASTPETRALWPHDFKVSLTVSAGEELALTLSSTNTGTAPFRITDALHTFLAVSDIGSISVSGLEDARYLEEAGPAAERTQSGAIRVTGETDRIYRSEAACVLHDDEAPGTVTVEKKGFPDTIVWNPWIEKSRRLPNFGERDYLHMLCIESGSTGENFVLLEPSMTVTQTITIRTAAVSL